MVLGNVSGGHYPMRFVFDHLQDLYWCCTTEAANQALGEPRVVGTVMRAQRFGGLQNRDRGYLNLRNKVKSLEDVPPLARFQRRFSRSLQSSWIDAFLCIYLKNSQTSFRRI